ncbi:hypothetical protein PF010_g24902 [Phytophthora fragariae]|uniref:Reverse transcriptase Ty1/copia-type domain-containing protein n=1 Tax=Phytophthora fragariae TaxID=53985 RepID=A0A6G0K1R0_9STRA|nr:hypothetical protein PF010_g24902 [Phytophthora fragariae]
MRYTRGEGEDECIVCLYVDDMLIASRQKAAIASVKAGIAEKFRIKDLGRARFILGIEIDYDLERRTLSISQKACTESIIEKFGQENAKPCLTPLEPGVQFTEGDEPQTEENKTKMMSKPYRSLVGSLIYLACGMRPDISVAVAKLSRFLENPCEKHWDAGIAVVRYLLKTNDVGIVCDGLLGTQLEAYSDANWAGNRDDRRSVSGMLLMLCGAPVVWRSTFQKTVALSSTEAEYMALSDCVKECVWMRRLLKDIGAGQVGAYGDLRGQPRSDGSGKERRLPSSHQAHQHLLPLNSRESGKQRGGAGICGHQEPAHRLHEQGSIVEDSTLLDNAE